MSVAWLVIAAFFIIALVYSSVGFGGGSSYLAVLALPVVGLAFPVIRSTALFCNLIVVTGGLIVFYREGKLSMRDAWPYLLGSVPMAYIGGKWPIQEQTFFILLGFTLVVVPFLLWFQPEVNQADSGRQASPVVKGLIGGVAEPDGENAQVFGHGAVKGSVQLSGVVFPVG
jgi:uncharacterized membrane protein YfcA